MSETRLKPPSDIVLAAPGNEPPPASKPGYRSPSPFGRRNSGRWTLHRFSSVTHPHRVDPPAADKPPLDFSI